MMRALLLMALAASLLTVSGCETLADILFDSESNSYEERRRKLYESKGVDPKRARRMAFEDEFWGGSPTIVR